MAVVSAGKVKSRKDPGKCKKKREGCFVGGLVFSGGGGGISTVKKKTSANEYRPKTHTRVCTPGGVLAKNGKKDKKRKKNVVYLLQTKTKLLRQRCLCVFFSLLSSRNLLLG